MLLGEQQLRREMAQIHDNRDFVEQLALKIESRLEIAKLLFSNLLTQITVESMAAHKY